MNSQHKVKLGIISFAHVHAPNYAREINTLDEAALVGIFDQNEYRGKQAAAQFNTEYFSDLDELLAYTDGIIICSENATHKDFAIHAASSDTHILCEKPIATNLEEADDMIEACRKNEVRLHIAFPMRYSPPVVTMKEHIEEGEIGKLLGISSTNHGRIPPGWFQNKQLAGGGAVMDHTVHLVDLFCWIFNQGIKEVYAKIGTLLHDIEVEDCGLLSLKFEKEGFATLDCSWSRPDSFPTWGDLKMRVYGTNGVLDLDAFRQNFTVYNDERKSKKWEYWGTNSDREMIIDFIRAIKKEPLEGTLATGREGRKSLQVALSAYRSAKKGQPVAILD